MLEPGEAPPLHLHPDTEQIFYLIQGKGTLRIGEHGAKQFPVGPGDVVRVPPHTLHSILCESPESIIYVSVDCFVNGRPEAEPTFEAHTRNLCKDNGWDYDEVYQPK